MVVILDGTLLPLAIKQVDLSSLQNYTVVPVQNTPNDIFKRAFYVNKSIPEIENILKQDIRHNLKGVLEKLLYLISWLFGERGSIEKTFTRGKNRFFVSSSQRPP